MCPKNRNTRNGAKIVEVLYSQITYYVEYRLHKAFLSVLTQAWRGALGRYCSSGLGLSLLCQKMLTICSSVCPLRMTSV